MATLKEHQAAMVDLLANGSGIPASASRLAHAMHDILAYLVPKQEDDYFDAKGFARLLKAKQEAETTPGINDKALSKPQKALKTDSPAKWPTPAEQRVKELENTIRQLKAQRAKLKQELEQSRKLFESGFKRCVQTPLQPEQAGCRKPDTQVCEHEMRFVSDESFDVYCIKCGAPKQ